MNKTLYIFILLLLAACNNRKQTTEQTAAPGFTDTVQVVTDTVAQNPVKTLCNCTDYTPFKSTNYYTTDLSFYGYDNPRHNNDSLFELYASDSLRMNVRSVRFSNFDTIPKRYAVFKNVTHVVVIDNRKNIYGLDMFPNLKSVFFEGVDIELNEEEKWLRKIEGIYAGKTRVKGLSTFKNTPNLREIYFGHASFDTLPKDFDALKCLRRITLGAYRGNVDLSKLDLGLNPCLEFAEFQTWYDAFTGIPKGLDTTRNFKLIVEHQRLTKEEKALLKAYNANRKR